MYHKLFLLFQLLAFQISDLIFCDPVREKRSLLCKYGLSVIEEQIHSSLKDAAAQDTIPLGSALNGQLQDGVMKGMSSLGTSRDVEVTCDQNDIVIIRIPLKLTNIEVWFRWVKQVVPLCRRCKLKGTVSMTAKEMDFEIEIHMDTNHGMHFNVTKSELSKMDGVKFGFTGIGPGFNGLMSEIMTIMYDLVKKDVSKVIGEMVKETMEQNLSKM